MTSAAPVAGAGPVHDEDDLSEASSGSNYTDEHHVSHEDKIVLGYSVQKWIKCSDLSTRIKEARRRAEEEMESKESVGEDLNRKEAEEVDHYWNDKPLDLLQNMRLVLAVRVIEEVFSTWIDLKRMRDDRKFMGFSIESKVIVMQNAIRRLLAVNQVRKLMTKKKHKRAMLSSFAEVLADGRQIRMFSRKYGTANIRTLKISDDFKSFTYQTGKYNPPRYIEIKQIFKVHKGMSSQVYPKSTPKHKAYTFHLVMLGGQKCLDFEALSGRDFTVLYNGFAYLNKVAYGPSPFYIDKSGVPCRAVGSFLKLALPSDHPRSMPANERIRKKGAQSEASLMRYRLAATQGLSAEYAAWAQLRDKEKKMYDAALLESRRQELLHADVANEGEKEHKINDDDDDDDVDDDDDDDDDDGDGDSGTSEESGEESYYREKAAFDSRMRLRNHERGTNGRGERVSGGDEGEDDDCDLSIRSGETLSVDSSSEGGELSDGEYAHRQAIKAHRRVRFRKWRNFEHQLNLIYDTYCPEKKVMVPQLVEHFQGKEVALLFELYKKYRVQTRHAYLFGQETHDGDDDTHVDSNAPPPLIGSQRWHQVHFALMDQYGLRTDDYHDMESVELSISGELKSRPPSIKTDSDHSSGGSFIGRADSASKRSQRIMDESFTAMYGSQVGHTEGDEEKEGVVAGLPSETSSHSRTTGTSGGMQTESTYEEEDVHDFHGQYIYEESQEEEEEEERSSESESSGDDPSEETAMGHEPLTSLQRATGLKG